MKDFLKELRALNLGTGMFVAASNHRSTILPLPAGEGRGEGESLGSGHSTSSWKVGIRNIFGTGALLLAILALLPANAQNLPQPAAQPPVDISVKPPTLSPGIDPNSPFGQVIQMVQSGTAENTVLAYISNSSTPFNLSPADVTYLNDLGTPSDVEAAMTQRDKELGASTGAPSSPPAPSNQAQEPQDVTEDYFYGALTPYGTWINIPDYGLCWQPCAAAYDANWTPYCTLGQWIYTDSGWYWLSGYSWGWCVFHYGRWFHDAQRGWCWWPSTTWGPSWVFWRYSGSYCGWAPLPPHCYYSEENGLTFKGAPIASDYDFGMDANLFSFVPMANLCDAGTERFRLSTAQAEQVFAQSKVLDDINANDRIIANDGIPVSQVAKFTHGNMRSFTIQPAGSVALPGARGEQILPDGETLAINRPYFNANVPSALKQGVWPIAAQQQPVAHQPPTYIVNQIPYSYPSAGDQNNNGVIYVDSAGQNGPPVPTVTTAGPQDSAGFAPSPVAAPGASYWSVSAEAPAPVNTASAYMSPRSQSHEHLQQKAQSPANHRDFNPSAGGSRPVQHQEGNPAAPGQSVHLFVPGPNAATSHDHSSAPGTPAHNGTGSPPPDHGHGH